MTKFKQNRNGKVRSIERKNKKYNNWCKKKSQKVKKESTARIFNKLTTLMTITYLSTNPAEISLTVCAFHVVTSIIFLYADITLRASFWFSLSKVSLKILICLETIWLVPSFFAVSTKLKSASASDLLLLYRNWRKIQNQPTIWLRTPNFSAVFFFCPKLVFCFKV